VGLGTETRDDWKEMKGEFYRPTVAPAISLLRLVTEDKYSQRNLAAHSRSY
jgi:hypothetical protein